MQSNPPSTKWKRTSEALLINVLGMRVEHRRGVLHAPIDACYRLVGLIRMHWHGLSGGTEVWQEIGDFFAAETAVAGTRW